MDGEQIAALLSRSMGAMAPGAGGEVGKAEELTLLLLPREGEEQEAKANKYVQGERTITLQAIAAPAVRGEGLGADVLGSAVDPSYTPVVSSLSEALAGARQQVGGQAARHSAEGGQRRGQRHKQVPRVVRMEQSKLGAMRISPRLRPLLGRTAAVAAARAAEAEVAVQVQVQEA